MTFALVLAFALPVAAHEQRQVGKYTLEVGWRDEPVFEGALNAVQIEVHETATGKGVEGVAKTLHVLVSFGGSNQTFELALELVPGVPGVYTGAIIPTRTGDYIFRLTGTIVDLNVDERFESGPGRFDVVRSPTSLQFPDQAGSDVALARDQRTTREIAEQSRVLALGGLALGIVSIGFAFVSLRGRPRTP
ncbi:MAG TPA: hypothetical protein VGS17_13705 [Candidatus Limnocylindria bacterium]|nr:hypothetical protein [Candidatus Limnocylindria bacterium]